MSFPSDHIPIEEGFVRHHYYLSIDADTIKNGGILHIVRLIMHHLGPNTVITQTLHKSSNGIIYYYYLDFPIKND
jgi:hypothetical protein